MSIMSREERASRSLTAADCPSSAAPCNAQKPFLLIEHSCNGYMRDNRETNRRKQSRRARFDKTLTRSWKEANNSLDKVELRERVDNLTRDRKGLKSFGSEK